MKKTHIKDKLHEIGIDVNDLILGDYDKIARFTAEKQRDQNDPLYKSVGCFFTPNRERAILICSLIKQYGLSSFLEIGFGRGYVTLCVAKLFYELGINGKIITIDPNFDEKHLQLLTQIFPQQWLQKITFLHGSSADAIPTLEENYDLVYVDGDHSYEAVKQDWSLIKNKVNSIVVFDDYHLPSKQDPGIQCAKAIDEIDEKLHGFNEKELIRMDRRIFVDERKFSDDQIDYGQLLMIKSTAKLMSDLW